MSENQKRILQMLSEGKITVDEASRLLYLLGEENAQNESGAAKDAKPSPKYLYVRVEPKPGHEYCGKNGRKQGKVNIRVPVGLIRAGIKLRALIPPHVADDINDAMKEKGISFDIRDLKDEYLEGLIAALTLTGINVDSDAAEVHIHAE